MVGRNVQQDGDVSTEVIHVVELEGTEFDDVVFMWIFSHLECQRIADISCQSCIVTCLLENVIY